MRYKIEVEYRKSNFSEDIFAHVEYLDSEAYAYPTTRAHGGVITVGNLTVLHSNFITSRITEVEDEDEEKKDELPSGLTIQVTLPSEEITNSVLQSINKYGCRGGC